MSPFVLTILLSAVRDATAAAERARPIGGDAGLSHVLATWTVPAGAGGRAGGTEARRGEGGVGGRDLGRVSKERGETFDAVRPARQCCRKLPLAARACEGCLDAACPGPWPVAGKISVAAHWWIGLGRPVGRERLGGGD